MRPTVLAWWQQSVLGAPGVNPQAADFIWQSIDNAYSHPARAFHTWDHIERLFVLAAQYDRHIKDSYLFRLAILAHDYYYHPGDRHNEETSSRFFHYFGADLGLNQAEVQRAARLVVATHHPFTVKESDGRLLADLDLASLALPWERFHLNFRLIVQEYFQANLDYRDYVPNSLRFWQSMLERRYIYQTRWLRARYEQQARANISRYVSELRAEQARI